MFYLFESISAALSMICTLDEEVLDAVWTSVYTSFSSIVFAAVLGIPAGLLLGLSCFRGHRVYVTLLNTLMALPTVVVGLFLFGLFSRQGPLGAMGLLFTPLAMIAGQSILATPIVANYTMATVTGADQRIFKTALTLGATRTQASVQLLQEVRFGLMIALIAGFGRVIAEVGVAMMLGGNIRGSTRTMTTAIALETSKGEFVFGLALGIVLMTVALCVNLLLNFVQKR